MTGGEDKGAARRDGLASDLHRRRAGDPCLPADEVTALAHEAIHCDRVVPGIGGLVADAPGHERPVGRDHGGAGHAGDAPPLRQEVSGAHHHFGGDAAPVGALTADELGLDTDNVEARLSQFLRDLLTARAQPDDDGVGLHRSTARPSW